MEDCSTIDYTTDIKNALVDALVSIIAKSCKGMIGYICHEENKFLASVFINLRKAADDVSRTLTRD